MRTYLNELNGVPEPEVEKPKPVEEKPKTKPRFGDFHIPPEYRLGETKMAYYPNEAPTLTVRWLTPSHYTKTRV